VKYSAVVLTVLLVLSFSAVGGEVKLVWDANPPADLVQGYIVYEHASDTYTRLVDVKTNRATVLNVPPGYHCYVVTATNAWGESDFSNSACTEVMVGDPLTGITISAQPQDLTAVVFEEALFSVSATGSGPLSYQWRFQNTPIANATSSTLLLTNLQPGQAGQYDVVVSEGSDSVISSKATLTLLFPPVVVVPPQNQVVRAGANAAFFVTASNTVSASYQWRHDGLPLSGATGSALNLTNVQLSQAGPYDVLISNPAGSALSAAALLEVLLPPAILIQPRSQTVLAGTNVTLAVAATSESSLAYQWRRNGQNLPNATNAVLQITQVRESDAGSYDVVLSDAAGFVVSAAAALTVVAPPAIVQPPSGQTVAEGSAVEFNVVAGGTAPLRYQWRFQEVPLAGATGPTLVLTNVQRDQAGLYDVRITNAFGAVLSSSANLSVLVGCGLPLEHLLGWWPGDGNGDDIAGANPGVLVNGAGFTGAGLAGGAFRFDGVDDYVEVGAAPDLAVSKALSIEAWIYPATTGGSDGKGGIIVNREGEYELIRYTDGTIQWMLATSVPGWMWVTTPVVAPADTWSHVVLTYTNGLAVTYLNGLSEHSYSATGLIGDTDTNSQAFSIGGREGGGRYFDGLIDEVSIYDVALTAEDVAAIYDAGSQGKCLPPGPPIIAKQPEDTVALTGTSVRFQVRVAGHAQAGYQWRFQDTPIPGATSDTLVLDNVQPEQTGAYDVMVFNADGNILSSKALLSVLPAFAILTQPQSQTVPSGQNVAFSITVADATPPAYQWRRNGQPIPGATNAALIIRNARADTDAGTYDVVVSNAEGSILSAPAVLLILNGPLIVQSPVSLSVTEGETAPFSAAATGLEPLSYQWRFEEAPILGATSSTLILTNATSSQSGRYDVMISDEGGTTLSAKATLAVQPSSALVDPVVIQPPLSQEAVAGGTVVFSVQSAGTLPMGYRWRFGSRTVKSEVLLSHVAFLVLTNVSAADAGKYTVVLTNAAFYLPGVLSPAATLSVLADSDGDGLPDAWEATHGLNADGPEGAARDTDGDGFTDGQEYISGTNPLDPQSYLKLDEVVPGWPVTIRFQAVSNKTYSIQFTDAAAGATWSNLTDVAARPFSHAEVVADPKPAWRRFYRLVTPAIVPSNVP
jgi:Concanavalin A-like lectin/glucanases superfamily/Immunoglobulin domain/Bacterial TSP3 repeat